MKKLLLLASFLFLYSASAWADDFQWKGEFVQGGLIIGKHEDPQTKIKVDGVKLRLSESGDFVFGYGRDAGATSEIEFIYSNGKTVKLEKKIRQREYKIQRVEGIAKSIMAPSKENIARSKNDNRQIAAARKTDSSGTGFLQQFVWPAVGPVSGVYGSQRVFNGVPKRPHYGLDVAVPVGTEVVAPADGVVTLAHSDMFYSGGTMIIDHGFGVSSTLLHLSKLLVKAGDEVKQGDLVARSGASGRVSGPHLDWRINWFSTRLDPALLLNHELKP